MKQVIVWLTSIIGLWFLFGFLSAFVTTDQTTLWDVKQCMAHPLCVILSIVFGCFIAGYICLPESER